ncbi:DUF916 and DUF3324 domain-containing protein [Enterococcus sp. LJL120]
MNCFRHKIFQKLLISLCCSLFLWIGFVPIKALATNTENSAAASQDIANAMGFTFTMVYPENQTDQTLGYYDLVLTPEEKQTVSIVLTNPGAESIDIAVALNGAKTNRSGNIEYSKNDLPKDDSLKYSFEELVSGPNSLTLAAGETKTLELEIQMVPEKLTGVIVGGLQLMRQNQVADETTDSQATSQIFNQYAYLIPIVLQQNTEVIPPDLQFNQAYGGQSSGQNVVFINFSNVAATFVNDMTVAVQIATADSQAVLYETKKTQMRMAPNSLIEFPVPIEEGTMQAGEYVANIQITAGELSWEWQESFAITDGDANQYNERTVGLLDGNEQNWQVIVGLLLGFVLIVVGVFFFVRYLRKTAAQKNKNRRKKPDSH